MNAFSLTENDTLIMFVCLFKYSYNVFEFNEKNEFEVEIALGE